MAGTGTGGVKFKALSGTDTDVKNGVSYTISTNHMCITCMKECEAKSLEELRWEDYMANRKGTHLVKGGLFGSSSNPFCRSIWSPVLQCQVFPNNNNFSFTGSQPSFSNKTLFGFPATKPDLKPCFGNASTSKADVQIKPETQSFFLKTITNPSKMDNKPTFGTKDTLFNLPSKTSTLNNNPSNFSFGSTTSTKKIFKLKRPLFDASAVSSITNTSREAAAVQGGFEKVNFSFNNSKIVGLQGKLPWQNPELENYAEDVKKLVSDLQGLIECPVCFASLDSSLKQCENGHGICGSCNINVEKCPTCQHVYLPYKPILLWQILDRLPKPCLFADKGCDKILFSQKEEHETFCKFRPTSCKFQSCEWKGTVEAVTEHVRTCKNGTEYSLCELHFPNVKVNNLYKFIKTQDTTLCSAVIFKNQLFWKHFQRDSLSKMISYKFYHITSSKPKQKYYLVVSFSKGEIEFKMCVAASYETEKNSEDKKCNEMSFYLSDEDLERFYDTKAEGYRYTQYIVVEDICSEKNLRELEPEG